MIFIHAVDCLLALFVLNEKNEKILFCDEGLYSHVCSSGCMQLVVVVSIIACFAGVYTRNRNFRLFLSTKLGKEARLTVARENKFKVSVCL